MIFTPEEIDSIKSILRNADDQLLYELFGQDLFETVKARLKEVKRKMEAKGPYRFNNRFPDIK